MLTSKVQLGYVLTGGGGQAVQGGLSCPLPRISERIDNPQILLHHLLQKYLVPRPEFQRELIIPKFYYTIYYRNI